MEDDQQFCLRWNNHQATLIAVFDKLLENETLVDCTLAAEGKYLNAHKVVLSACSPYFESLLSQNYDKHPIFILKDVKFLELKAMMDYMYRGEVNISQDSLSGLLRAAESLQIKGLSDNRGAGSSSSRSGAGDEPQPKRQAQAAKLPNKGQGLTITEQSRVRKVVEPPLLMQDDREGSTSPGPSRRRKRARRKSTDTEDNLNHHDGASNSSESHQSGGGGTTTTMMGSTSAPTNNTTTTIQGTNKRPTQQPGSEEVPAPLIETKAEIHHVVQKQNQDQAAFTSTNSSSSATGNAPLLSSKQEPSTSSGSNQNISISQAEVMLEPKSEYIDDMNEDSIEDLTLDDDDLSNMEDGAGPSGQGGGESNQDPFSGLLPSTRPSAPPGTSTSRQNTKPRLPRLIRASSTTNTTTPITHKLKEANLKFTSTASRTIRKPIRFISDSPPSQSPPSPSHSSPTQSPELLPTDPLSSPTPPPLVPFLNTYTTLDTMVGGTNIIHQGAQYDVDMLMYGLSGHMRKYAPETVQWALDAILNRGASVTAASQASGIKRTSLHLYLKKLNIRKVRYDGCGGGVGAGGSEQKQEVGGSFEVGHMEGGGLFETGETSGGLIIEEVRSGDSEGMVFQGDDDD